jgi:hypothetical protein
MVNGSLRGLRTVRLGSCPSAGGGALPLGSLAGLAQDEEPECARRCGGKRKRTGVGDDRAQVLQGSVADALRIALSGFRKLDDLASDHLTNWISVVGGGAEGRKGRLESEAHETDSLKVERLAIQEAPDRHESGSNCTPSVAHGHAGNV